MHLHHLRNATTVVELGDAVLLIDPMLGPKGSFIPFTVWRFKARKNPLVDLPPNGAALLERVTHVLLTHRHPDHWDATAVEWVRAKQLPVWCSTADAPALRKQGISIGGTVAYGQRQPFLKGQIEGVPARHGYGLVARLMGSVMGFYLEWPGEPSLYCSSDTILTSDVERVLTDYQPDVNLVAAGSAQLDLLQPLLMKKEDLLRFVQLAKGTVVYQHLEALNHRPTTRQALQTAVEQAGYAERVCIPEDGASRHFGT